MICAAESPGVRRHDWGQGGRLDQGSEGPLVEARFAQQMAGILRILLVIIFASPLCSSLSRGPLFLNLESALPLVLFYCINIFLVLPMVFKRFINVDLHRRRGPHLSCTLVEFSPLCSPVCPP